MWKATAVITFKQTQGSERLNNALYYDNKRLTQQKMQRHTQKSKLKLSVHFFEQEFLRIIHICRQGKKKYSLVTAVVYAYQFLIPVVQFVGTHRYSYETIFFRKKNYQIDSMLV